MMILLCCGGREVVRKVHKASKACLNVIKCIDGFDASGLEENGVNHIDDFMS